MIKFRFLIIVLIILITGIVLQSFKIVNFTSFFRTNSPDNVEQTDAAVKSSMNIPSDFDQYIVLYSAKDEESNTIAYHLQQIFRNSHMSYVLADIDSVESSLVIREIEIGDTIIIAAAELGSIIQENIEHIENIVYRGAEISILVRSTHPTLIKMAGIQEIFGFLPENSIGIEFQKQFFPILDELLIDSPLITSSSLDIMLNDSITPIAKSPDGTPLIWLNSWGEGSVLYTNSTLFLNKINRGLLLQLLLLNNDYGLSYITADKIITINDLPSPIPQGQTESIYTDYLRDNIKFYREIWWSDLVTLKNKYDLSFTGMAIGSYTSETKSPLPDITSEDLQTIKTFGTLLSSSGGELGIMGYNHTPLTTVGEITNNPVLTHYPSLWADSSSMIEGLEKLRDALDSIFGEIGYYSYTAPFNLTGSYTKDAVLTVFPELKVFSGIYTNAIQQYGIDIQELGPDPDNPGVYDIPSFSQGYEITPGVLWAMANGAAEIGMLNHSISTIELLDPEKSDILRWGPLFRDFEDMFKSVSRYYPFLEPKTNIEAYNEYIQNENMHFYTNRENDASSEDDASSENTTITIQLENVMLPQKFYFRCDSPISSIRGGVITPLKRDNLYILEANKTDIIIQTR